MGESDRGREDGGMEEVASKSWGAEEVNESAALEPRLRAFNCFSNTLMSARTSFSASSRFSTESSMDDKRTF
jgi:hypothetical protein